MTDQLFKYNSNSGVYKTLLYSITCFMQVISVYYLVAFMPQLPCCESISVTGSYKLFVEKHTQRSLLDTPEGIMKGKQEEVIQ